MAERDGSARRKKKTKRQTIRVPVDEVPRRVGAGSAPLVAEEPPTDDPVGRGLSIEEPQAPPGRRPAPKTVVDVDLPAGLLESLEDRDDEREPTQEFETGEDDDDDGEVSVDVDVSEAERISVTPAVPADAAAAAMLSAHDDLGDRPTPPPKDAPWRPMMPDPGDRPTPPPVAPSASSLLFPVVPPAVVVMSPIRSIGIAAPEPQPEPAPEPDPAPEPELLPKVRPTTKQGVAPPIPPLVDGLEWSPGDGAGPEVPFEGVLPGEGEAAEPQPAASEAPSEVAAGDGADSVPVDVEEPGPTVMLPPEPLPIALAAPPPEPVPAALPPKKTPVPPPSAVEVADLPVDEDAEDAEPLDDRDSDPGTVIEDLEAEALPVVPAVPKAPSTPKPPITSPPPPPSMPLPPAPISFSMPAIGRTTTTVPLTAPPPIPLPAPPPVPGEVARAEAGERRRKGRKWWEDFFNEEWLKTIPPVPEESTRKECDFIESALGVETAASILDLGCGTGRHSVELASRGYSVVALDLSLAMLDRAQRAAEERDVKVTFQQADMRDLSFDNSFDAVYCIGTTLGLFDEEGNLQVIRNAHRALRENGTFLIEVVNRDFVLQAQPNVVWFEGDGCVCMEETNINYINSRLQVKRTVMPDEGGQTETEYSVRLFSLHELGSLLHRNGFRVLEVSGHWATRGVFFGAHSQRLLVLAEKRVLAEGIPTITQTGAAPLKSGSGS